MKLEDYIRDVPDFPKPGIVFKDISPLLKDSFACNQAIYRMWTPFVRTSYKYIVGIESRGFVFGSMIANAAKKGFIMLRKKGKLPGDTIQHEYQLEYGSDVIELQKGLIPKGSKVVLIDDVLATGGTALAACELLKKAGVEVVACSFLIELTELKGKEKIENLGIEVFSSIQY